jgi:hypothetical protein
MSYDDWHITLRLGTAHNWCNLHGHFYIVFEDNKDAQASKAVRMLKEEERGIVGGKNPQLFTWGPLPRGYVTYPVKHPTTPFEIVPGSILDKRDMQG